MKLGKVISLSDYKAERLLGTSPGKISGAAKPLPDAENLWELLDRNISLKFWEKGI
jgi:hypothetical protein